MSTPVNRVEWCGDYEIHYCAPKGSRTPTEGPITVYFPLRGEAYCSRFIPTPGLVDTTSESFDAKARLVKTGPWGNADRFVVGPDGIYTSNPHITGLTGIVDRLIKSGGLKHVFKPCELPPLRWENVDLLPLAIPASLTRYCDALRSVFTNGFVECKAYEIAAGATNEAILEAKGLLFFPGKFLEILRHPLIRSDFRIEEADETSIGDSKNWTRYSPFLFSGYLAQTLSAGGAYIGMWDDLSVPLALADAVLNDFNRDYRNFDLSVCRKPWCRRFCDIAWDHTWIISDRELRRLTILMASDTD
jgi:hypothetical protein